MSAMAQALRHHEATDLIDLDRYPILTHDTTRWRVLLDEGRTQIASRGACFLPGFVKREAVAALAAEAMRMAPLAYGVHTGRELYTYSEVPNPALPPDHCCDRKWRAAPRSSARDYRRLSQDASAEGHISPDAMDRASP